MVTCDTCEKITELFHSGGNQVIKINQTQIDSASNLLARVHSLNNTHTFLQLFF